MKSIYILLGLMFMSVLGVALNVNDDDHVSIILQKPNAGTLFEVSTNKLNYEQGEVVKIVVGHSIEKSSPSAEYVVQIFKGGKSPIKTFTKDLGAVYLTTVGAVFYWDTPESIGTGTYSVRAFVRDKASKTQISIEDPKLTFFIRSKVQVIKDRDNDGVPDDKDVCSGTIDCSMVKSDTVCETYNGYQDGDGCQDVNPTDYDGDGVPDWKDLSPLHPGPKDRDGLPEEITEDGKISHIWIVSNDGKTCIQIAFTSEKQKGYLTKKECEASILDFFALGIVMVVGVGGFLLIRRFKK